MTLNLLLAACSGLFPPAPETPNLPLPSQTETPTTVWFPPTSTSTVFPTSVQLPTLEEHPGLGEALLTDNFDQPKFWTTASAENARAVLELNRLTLTVSPGLSILSLRSEPLLSDFYAEVTARLSLCRANDRYGLIFRVNSQADYYSYTLNCNGQVRLERVHSGETVPLQDWLPSGEAPAGAPGDVKLGIWFVGVEMRLFLNERFQFTVRDHVFQSGTLGLFASSRGTTQETVSFTDLTVYTVSYLSPTPAATPLQTQTPTRKP